MPKNSTPKTHFSDAAIYDVLFRAIHEHHLLPNTHLRENELAKAFHTSRTRVRKILQQLIFEGLVTQVPFKGSFVTALTSEQVQQLFATRRIIELGIINLLTLPLDNTALEPLRRLIEAESQAKLTNHQPLVNKLSGDIHLFLAQLTGNHYLINFLTQLIAQTSLAIAIYGNPNHSNSPHICDSEDDAHTKLLTLLAHNDKQAVSNHLLDHLYHIEQQLLVTPNPANDINIGQIIQNLSQ